MKTFEAILEKFYMFCDVSLEEFLRGHYEKS